MLGGLESGVADDEPTRHVGDSPADALEEQRALNAIKHSLFERSFRPLTLSRYVLTERLGAGGAGIVYRAFDPELRRQVAIKIVRTSTKATSARERLRREAQAIARLTHPNVVSIYDVGALEAADAGGVFGRGLYLVMELVEGKTLRQWLSARSRPWQEVLDVFLGAARGLEAAHEAGIVHRDFKPANVLVGADGRAKVLDFGLATAVGAAPDSSSGAAASVDPIRDIAVDEKRGPQGAPLTREGTVMGTPPYMAPEQHEGERADTRTDQYALCAALWEGLAGHRPFVADDPEQLCSMKRRGPPPPPSNSSAPKWIFGLLARGLAPVPDDRWPSIDALIGVIQKRRKRTRRVFAAAIALLIVGSATAGMVAFASRSANAPCESLTAETVWSPAQRRETEAAFRGSGLAFAPTTWAKVDAKLSTFAQRWARQREQLCRDTASGAVAAEEFTQKDACLERHRQRFDSLARRLAVADPAAVTNASLSVSNLPDLTDCERGEALSPRLRIDDDRVREIDQFLREASAEYDLGRYQRARAMSHEALSLAERVGDHLGEARAARQLALVANNSGHRDEGAQWSRRGLLAAEASRDERQIVHQLLGISAHAPDLTSAELWLDLAQRRIEHIDPEGADHRLAADLAAARASAARGHDDHLAALEHARRAVTMLAEAVGADAPQLIYPLNTLAMTYDELGDLQRALETNQRALDLSREHLGDFHPATASLLNNRGSILRHHGHDERALDVLIKALERKEATHGRDAKRLLTTLLNLSYALANTGRFERARGFVDRMQSIAVRPPSSGDDVLLLYSARAHLLRSTGCCEEAMPVLERALDMLAADPGLESRSTVWFEWAACNVDLQRAEVAWAAADHALALDRAEYGPHHRKTVRTLWLRSRAAELVDDDRGRIADLDQAYRICSEDRADGRWCGRVAFELARFERERSPDRSRDLGEQALDELTRSDADAELVRELLRWRSASADE